MTPSHHAARRRHAPRGGALVLLAAATLAAAPRAGAQRAPAADHELVALDLATLLARGDSAWNATREGALPYYREVVRRDSAASTRALFRLATLRSWRDELAEAVALHARYVREEPRDAEGRVALGRVLAWAGRFDAAIASYDTVLATIPDHRDAALGRAQALAWAGRTHAAIADYERWLRARPDDRAAELELARAESWAGRLDDAERRYQRLADAGEAGAGKGVARVAGWRGDLARSERLWRALTARYPDDPEAWTGLAQVLRWSGRATEAEAALGRALELEPAYGDARSQLQWVRADLAPALEPIVVHANDSDHNRSTFAGVTGGITPWWNGRVTAQLSRRDAEYGDTRATSLGVRTVAWWNPLGGRLSVRGELGLARLGATVNGERLEETVRPATALAIAVQPHRRVSLGAGLSRLPFDETALLIRNRLVTGALEGDASVMLPGRVTIAASAGRGVVSGGVVENARTSIAGTVRWTMRRGLSFAAAARTFGYERASYDTTGGLRSDGYFAPESYRLLESSARWEPGRDLGWFGSTELGLGRQSIRPFVDVHTVGASSGRFAQRATAWLGYRFAPGAELATGAGFANVAAPQTVRAAEYRAWSVTVRGRVRM